MAKKKIKFMCTAFRDGFQSAYGARVLTADFLPALQAAVDAGMDYFECGGGARFQSLFFYCNENAFDMMDAFRQTCGPQADLQTLARGVNVVGLESQSADVIDLHAKLFKKHGVSTIRNFDALNDVNNLIYSGQAIVDAGLNHQVCVTLMELPPGCTGAHDAAFYAKTLREILEAKIPFSSVCFKDASGTATPAKVYETILAARKTLPEGTLIHFHTHETAGTGVITYKAALDAGADLIDLSLAPCSGGTCQTDVLTMWHALRGTDFDLDIDIDKVLGVEDVFKECMKDYFLPPEATAVEPLIPWSPMPGGALTANTQMLRDNGIMDKFPEIIKAMREVVVKGGFGTSVTPVSQFYFQQAFNNVMFGPWKKIAESYGKMVLGYFGKTPVAPDMEVINLAKAQLNLAPTQRSPIDINNEDLTKGVGPAKKALQAANLAETDENIFIAATCKEKGIAFLLGKGEFGVRYKEKKEKEPAFSPANTNGSYTVTVEGKPYHVLVDGGHTTVDGQVFSTTIKEREGQADHQVNILSGHADGALTEIKSPMPGKIFKLIGNVGDQVKEGDPVIVLEAMKMETAVAATRSGVIAEILVEVAQQVAADEVLLIIKST